MSSLRELGELGVIRILERYFGTSPWTAVGFGDDVSAVKLLHGKVAVLKTDMLVESTDVPPGMSMRQVGRKAVVTNVSDLAAKGVKPIAGMVALGLPMRLSRRDIVQIASGLSEGSRVYGFPLIGGDTNESKDLTITLALFATADRSRLVLRSGARPGDIVAVTGDFGSTHAGLKGLLQKKIRPRELPRPIYDAVYNPRAELDLGIRLAASGALTASIDSSDGLAWSLHELAAASDVGIELHKVPVSKAALDFGRRHGYNPIDLALYGGEEYHLVVTVKREKFGKARRAARGRLKAIGVVSSGFSGVRLRDGARDVRIPMKGWEHFRQ